MQISAFCGQGAPGTIALGIHHVLESQGHQSVIAWGRGNSAPDTVPTIQIGEKKDYFSHALYTRLTDKCGFGSASATIEFLKKIDAFQPDLIQLHMMHGYFIHLGYLFQYLKKSGIPVVWTLHDSWAITGHCPYFDMIGCEKWKTGCHHCPQKSHHPASWLLDRSEWNWNKKRELFTSLEQLTIVTPSRWLEEIIQQSFLKHCPVRVINNGIDTRIFRPTPSDVKTRLQVDNKRIVLGVSSSWAPSKGMEDFCQMAEKLPDKYQIVLVGLSEKQIRRLPDQIIGIRKTDSMKELAELYTAAHVFVNPTYEDNYPTTNLEALACGTPVITYRTGGSVEAVQESGAGMIVGKGDLEALVRAVLAVPEPGHQRALYQCDERQRYQDYLSLYQQILYA